jgi:hypothetical protein
LHRRRRSAERDFENVVAFDGKQITQPVAFMAGSLEPVLRMIPGLDVVYLMRKRCADLRDVTLLALSDQGYETPSPCAYNS